MYLHLLYFPFSDLNSNKEQNHLYDFKIRLWNQDIIILGRMSEDLCFNYSTDLDILNIF